MDNNEQVLYETLLKVAINSAKFWLPIEQGVENNLYKFQSKLNSSNLSASSRGCCNWGKIFTTDAVGVVTGAAASVANSGGATAIPNPALGGMPTAGLVGLITGAGMSVAAGIAQT